MNLRRSVLKCVIRKTGWRPLNRQHLVPRRTCCKGVHSSIDRMTRAELHVEMDPYGGIFPANDLLTDKEDPGATVLESVR